MRCCVFSLLLLFIVSPLGASTLRVERDGSGDFLFIQDCVDSAASGDTILIGSGTFDEWHLYGQAIQYPARMVIPDIDLTVIGEEDGSTIIGPDEPWTPGDLMHQGVALVGNSNVVLRNLQLRNLRGGVVSWMGANIVVSDCQFTNIQSSMWLEGGTGVVENCNFYNYVIDGLDVCSYFQDDFLLSNCFFQTVDSGIGGHTTFVNVSGEIDAEIRQCVFRGGPVGCLVDRGGRLDIQDSVFENIEMHAVYLGTGVAIANIVDSRIIGCYRGITAYYFSYTFTVERTVFEDIEIAPFVVNHLQSGYVRNCLLEGGESGVIAYYPNQNEKEMPNGDIYDFDMRNNYWGTADKDSIQFLIEDNYDDPSIGYRVLWTPFTDQTVSSQGSSLESLKARFR